jgi:UDPglucose 6-dehydrogenase
MQPTIGFVGMTHLGLVSGVSAAEKGFQVVCFDPDLARIALMRQGLMPVSEPQLDALVATNAQRILFSADTADLQVCDVIYVAPDVATDDQGGSDLDQINTLLALALEVARPDAVVVVLSQVPPGFTRGKQQAGRVLYYQVETLIFGRAVERALYPERTIVGCVNPEEPLQAAYAAFLAAHNCPILPMRYESAELAKISINMCLVASVSVANMMAELCEQSGAAWSEIVPALRLDRRIGPYSYLRPGLGIAGGNLERDLATVFALAEQHGTDAGIVSAWVANSRYRKDWVWRILERSVLERQPDAKIAVLGLAYKEDTRSTKNSASLALLTHLKGRSVVVYDPVVALADAGSSFRSAPSAMNAIEGCDAICVMTPWEEFKKLSPIDMAKSMRGRWLIDPYNVIDGKAAVSAGLRYATIGVALEGKSL